MTVVWLKLLHVVSLAVWTGGILMMPILLGQRRKAGEGPSLHRLHLFTRFAYITVISPAAFVAIGSGTALILVQELFVPWFALKLFFVGLLVILHVWVGLLVLSVFDEGGRFAGWRVYASVGTLSGIMTAIFWVVLAKPDISLDALPAFVFQPGGLRSFAADIIPGLTP
ncbi:CopD family protein [Aureimonas glaciei]|uniref:Protoporphyrinogen IX oxidase n=1 Tax=Aureimonas glaciei TaxID=1776957 RepID=A0A916XVU8_9HYPH|nr:CopD family protein [Aureimonas glaciei]GGD15679.1 membrane protein [Aureimonas glaciei]